jgi:UDP-N-acetylmuramate dehydrogenase
VTDRISVALDVLGALGQRDVPLGARTTYRVGGVARILVTVRSVNDLRLVAGAHRASGLPVLAIGRGSNLLVADAGFYGIAVVLEGFDAITYDGMVVTVGGGCALPLLARATARQSLTGLEWAVGVPGSVGGAVRMNAGGHGSDVATTLQGVRIFNVSTGEDGEVPTSSLGLRFRGSDLHDEQIVVSARFALDRGDRTASEAEITEIVRWRREHQPGGQNAGSVFVNPIPGVLSAGQVIDEAGLRGFRLGTASVSNKHANFIQADEGGRADDVLAVMRHVRAVVHRERGIDLHSENRLVGFGPGVLDEAAS